jgi:hypothetical protein
MLRGERWEYSGEDWKDGYDPDVAGEDWRKDEAVGPAPRATADGEVPAEPEASEVLGQRSGRRAARRFYAKRRRMLAARPRLCHLCLREFRGPALNSITCATCRGEGRRYDRQAKNRWRQCCAARGLDPRGDGWTPADTSDGIPQ